MDLAMTVGAAPVEKTALIFQIITSMAGVTLIAKPRHAHFEQAVIDAAMGFVAIRTIVRNRRMLKKKRPPPLGVARVTVLVDTVLFELCGIGAAMGVVAVGADDLALSHGHMRRAHELSLALEMALPAHFYFGSLVEESSLVVNLR
jgi:hypothetical protein